MSYQMKQLSNHCIIRKRHFPEVKRKLIELYNSKKDDLWFVDLKALKALVESDLSPRLFVKNFLIACNWQPSYEKGDIVALTFLHWKYTSEHLLFSAIQDEVESMSIDMKGEEENWTWSILFGTGLKRLPRASEEELKGIPR